jgi:hypothetical protein
MATVTKMTERAAAEAAARAAAEAEKAAEARFAAMVRTVLTAPGGGNSDHAHVKEAARHIADCRGLHLDPLKTSRAQLASEKARFPFI